MLTDPDISHAADDELDRAIAERNEEMKAQADLSGISADEKRKKSALGHRDRVRERFLNTGLEGFADHEILELLLFYTIPRQDTKQIAHELIDRFDSVAGVFDADIEELCKTKGITQNSAVLFKLIPQLIGVYYNGKDEKKVIHQLRYAGRAFQAHVCGRKHRKVHACLLRQPPAQALRYRNKPWLVRLYNH